MTDVIQTNVAGADLYIIDDTNNTLVVDSTNVRVGIGTTTPGYELSVVGNIHGTALVQGVNLTIAAGGGGVLTFADGTVQATAATATGTIGGTIADTQVAFGTAADTIGGDANFSYATGTGTLLLGASNAGFLGVGTALAPTGGRVLEVQGSNAANNIILVQNTGGTSSVIQFGDTGTTNAPIIGSNGNDLILETQNAAGTINFEVNASQLAMQLKADKSIRMIGKIGDYNDTAPADGQVLIGNTGGATFDSATLTAGSGISITNGAGAITIASSITQSTGANPTATVSGSVVNGSATTFMRSDAAPALADTGVIAGSYTYSAITVDAQGRLTAAATGPTPMNSWTLAGDIGGETVLDGETVTVAGGTGMTTAVTAPDTVTLNLADTLITPGSYTYSTITVDQQGRLTAASSGAAPGTMSSFTLTGDSGSNQTISNGETLDVAGGTGISTVVGATDTVTVNLDDTAVSAGSYTYSAITVDAQGRLTSASSGSAPASAANPTATVSGSADNGSAATFMRSDAAPALANTAVTAGSYTRASLTVDAQGRLTAASSGSAPDISGTIAAGQVAYGASADTIEGDNNLFWDTTNDRLGIGTNAPSSSLHIIGIDDDNPEVRLQRTGVATQYLSLQNEDASGSFINSESAESNKKALYLQSVHNSGGSAGGDNLMIWRTGAASGPTERMRISDVNNLFTVQSTTDMNVESKLAVGKTSAPSYTLEVEGSNSQTGGFAELTGGLFSSSSGDSSLTNGMPGWWLTAKGMNTTSKYTPALKFGSTDPDFTTTNPKWTAGIIGEAIETYAADDKGGMDMHFLTAPAGVGVATVPSINMTLDASGKLGIGTTNPSATLHASTADNIVAKFLSTDATAAIELADNSTTNNAVLTRVGQTLTLCANGGNVAIGNSISSYNGSAPTDGQLLIGDTASGLFDAATLTAGSNITITNAAGAITIAAAGGGGGSPAGANTQVQFNDGGAFGASADMIFIAPNMSVGASAAGQTSGAIFTDTVNTVAMTASGTASAQFFSQAGQTPGQYGLVLSDSNMVWPGAPLGSSATIMPAIDLSAGPYDFASLGGAGNCSQTHYLFVVAGDPAGGNFIQMPDPAAAGLPPGARWTIAFNDGSGNQQTVEFAAVPLNGAFAQIEARAIGAVTIFTDGAGWFVESMVDTSGSGRITFL